jgi:polyisoprenoid-binding protein YceI
VRRAGDHGGQEEQGGIITFFLVVVVAVGVGAAALWWFVLRSDAAPKPTIESTAVVAGGTPDGTWRLTPDDDAGSFVQYRVQEQLGGDLVESTATGRTTDVEGSLTISGQTVPAAEIQANLAALTSDRDRRDQALRTRGLQTDEFPHATFRLTRPIPLPAAPVAGRRVALDATGDLTLHGITRRVTVPLQARWDGRTVQVVGELPVTFAQYGITPPDIAGFVTVKGEGTIELKLFFTKSG